MFHAEMTVCLLKIKAGHLARLHRMPLICATPPQAPLIAPPTSECLHDGLPMRPISFLQARSRPLCLPNSLFPQLH